MLGWMIIIRQQTPAPQDPTRSEETILARWEIGLSGIDWLTRLVGQGTAQQLQANGYPHRYTALARDVLPLLVEGPPQSAERAPAWTAKVIIHHEKITACSANQNLEIDAWDMA